MVVFLSAGRCLRLTLLHGRGILPKAKSPLGFYRLPYRQRRKSHSLMWRYTGRSHVDAVDIGLGEAERVYGINEFVLAFKPLSDARFLVGMAVARRSRPPVLCVVSV